MLSRVAENLYWFIRYVRRAENMARLVDVSSQLQLDLPRAWHIAWRPLIDTLGASEEFVRLHGDSNNASEQEVVRFVLLEPENPLSLRNVVRHARELLRAVRETLPQDIWVAVNDLYLYIEVQDESAVLRRNRQVLLTRVIDACLRVVALLTTNVSRDIGYQFMHLGAAIEQADMTTRIIDAAASGLVQTHSEEDAEAFRAMQWMAVLQSLAAYQMYRRHLRQRVSAEYALQFLLKDREFPRSVLFCLTRIQQIMPQMPQRYQLQGPFRRALGLVFDADPTRLMQVGPATFMDTLQLELADLHTAVHDAYFVG